MDGTQTKGRYLGVRLFLEGIEVDVISIKCSAALGSPATCEISIPTAPQAHGIKPRTLVHLFFMDSRYERHAKNVGSSDYEARGSSDPNVMQTVYDKSRKTPNEASKSTDRTNPRAWKLLFTGEVMGYSYSKQGPVRRIILHCQDFSSYWQQTKIYWGRNNTSLHGYRRAIFAGATQMYRGKSRVDTSNEVVRILGNRPSSRPRLPGLLGGIISLLESSTGCYRPNDKEKFRGVNDFISSAEMRLGLTRMIGASHEDRTSENFLAGAPFRKYFRRVTRSVKATASIMDLTQLLLQKAYHQWHPVLAPPYMKSQGMIETTRIVPVGFKFSQDKRVEKVIKRAEASLKAVGNMESAALAKRSRVGGGFQNADAKAAFQKARLSGRVDANTYDTVRMTTDISSNTPDDTGHVTKVTTIDWANHNVLAKGHRAGLGQYQAADRKDKCSEGELAAEGRSVSDKIRAKAGSSGNASGVKKQAQHIRAGYQHLEKAANIWSQKMAPTLADTEAEAHQTYGDDVVGESVSGPAGSKSDSGFTLGNLLDMKAQLEKGIKAIKKARRRPTKEIPATIGVNSTLHCFLFHPDIFMLPPPKCNVLFPDHIQAITFSRGWMSECTRLWLHGRTTSGRAQKNCYFSPNTGVFSGGIEYDKVKTSAWAVKKGHNFLMRHEAFTGINGAIVGLGDNDIFKKLHAKGLKQAKKDLEEAQKEARENDTPMPDPDMFSLDGDSVKGSRQAHLEKAANFMFFSARFASRTMGVTCRFSPQLVVGLPCLVLDPVWGGSGGPRAAVVKSKDQMVPDRSQADDAAGATMRILQPTYNGERPQGVHFAGQIGAITHSINADGGAQTFVQLVKCRETGEGASLFDQSDDADGLVAYRWKTIEMSRRIWPDKKTKEKYDTQGGKLFLAPVDKITAPNGTVMHTLASSPESAQKVLGHQYNKKAKYRITAVSEAPGSAGHDLGKDLEGETIKAAQVKVRKVWVVKSKVEVNFTFEAATFPPWFSTIYLPGNIGEKYYLPMVGCKSVVDNPVLGFEDNKRPDKEDFWLEAGESKAEGKVSLVQITIAGEDQVNDKTQVREVAIPDDLLDSNSSTSTAADTLAEVWMVLNLAKANTELFIDTYTDRKFANLIEVMGNKNPDLIMMTGQDAAQQWRKEKAELEVDGFHGWAYGTEKDHKKLPGEGMILKKYAPTSRTGEVDPKVDLRAVKYSYVLMYKDGIKSSQGGADHELVKTAEVEGDPF